MANKEETIDEALDRIIKQEFGDGFGDFGNSVNESIKDFGKSIIFLYENNNKVIGWSK